jgi:trk system potassium uptake protein TrkH
MKKHLSYTQIIALGFFLIIFLGATILSLPISSRTGEFTPFVDSLFTATSATCVTGLVAYDTYTHWSVFGQVIIITLIQIGGVGFMTVALTISLIARRKIGLKERNLMQEAVAAPQLAGMVKLTKFILLGTFMFEGVGAVLLAFKFCPEMGFIQGVYNAVFHSISAFCNAGFDLMGKYEQFSSLTRYSSDILVNTVIMSLIVIGGLGFFVWEDILENKINFKKYRLHTKIVLITTALLIIIPAVIIYIMETNNGASFSEKTTLDAVLSSLFQVITPRTAGFNTANLNVMTDASVLIMMILMFIGGSSGSTAGGIKTTTFAVLLMSIRATYKKENALNCFKRRLEDDILKRACTILMSYISLCAIATIIISYIDSMPLKETAFDVVSAIATVGMTLGITPDLGPISKLILAALMYFGRVGCLTMVFALSQTHESVPTQYPLEKISIG